MSAPFPPEIVAAMGGAPPTDEQWRAITMPLEPTVLVAGAGSGKTSVIAARVVYLALAALGRVEGDAPGVLPGNVLCLTFTVKATDNLRLAHPPRARGRRPRPRARSPRSSTTTRSPRRCSSATGILAGIEPRRGC